MLYSCTPNVSFSWLLEKYECNIFSLNGNCYLITMDHDVICGKVFIHYRWKCLFFMQVFLEINCYEYLFLLTKEKLPKVSCKLHWNNELLWIFISFDNIFPLTNIFACCITPMHGVGLPHIYAFCVFN
jgi:hypothetical protein